MIKIISLLPLIVVLISCGPKYETKYFKAISENKLDTALLTLHISDAGFYEDYQIRYDDKSTDDGTVTGNISGDTLLGKYKYLSKDNVRSIAPIVFLKQDEILKLGTGTAGTYMGFHVYARGSIVFKDSLFQFQPIGLEELNSLKK
jgi:hypothetical protein